LTGPNALRGGINNIENVLFVDLVTFVVINIEAEWPGTCLATLTTEEALFAVNRGPRWDVISLVSVASAEGEAERESGDS
jgi:hypothetical protein